MSRDACSERAPLIVIDLSCDVGFVTGFGSDLGGTVSDLC